MKKNGHLKRELFSQLEEDERIEVRTKFSHVEGHLNWKDLGDLFNDPDYFICGPKEMIEELSQGLLQGKGTPRERVHLKNGGDFNSFSALKLCRSFELFL